MAALSARAVIGVGYQLDIAQLEAWKVGTNNIAAVPWRNTWGREADGHTEPFGEHAGKTLG
jgi:hypothetical protein